MKAFIIEDEAPARILLERLLLEHCPEVEVVGQTGTITGAVQWLSMNQPDVIFMDVELSDGLCFEIFKMTDVKGKVIITTAYDNYAIRAFKVNSVDYLLKPVDVEELKVAVAKCQTSGSVGGEGGYRVDFDSIEKMFSPQRYKERFMVLLGDKIISIAVENVLYFYSEDKATYVVTRDNRSYVLDMTLDAVESAIDPVRFCRVSRNCIASFESVSSVSKYFNGKLKLILSGGPLHEVIVSRQRRQALIDWLNGE